MEGANLPVGLVLMLVAIALALYAVMSIARYYAIPLVKKRERQRRLEALAFRVRLLLWLAFGIFAYYRLLLAAPLFTLSLGGVTLFLFGVWWKDIYLGLMLRLEGDLSPGDRIEYNAEWYEVQAMRSRSARLQKGDGSIFILPYQLISGLPIRQAEDTSVPSTFTFEVVCAKTNALQFLEQLLAASPWTLPGYPATVRHMGEQAYQITAFAPDSRLKERQIQYIKQQVQE